MERIKTLEEARELLTEYKALPDLNAIIEWDGYKRLPTSKHICVCGFIREWQIHIDDLEWMVHHNQWNLEYHRDFCYGHTDDDDDEDEEEEEDE